MNTPYGIIDAWMQHPTPVFIMNPMFESLRRWLGGNWLLRCGGREETRSFEGFGGG